MSVAALIKTPLHLTDIPDRMLCPSCSHVALYFQSLDAFHFRRSIFLDMQPYTNWESHCAEATSNQIAPTTRSTIIPDLTREDDMKEALEAHRLCFKSNEVNQFSAFAAAVEDMTLRSAQ